MLQLVGMGVLFLIIAVVVALFGFGGSGNDSLAAKLFAGLFLLAALSAFGWAWMNRRARFV